MTSSGLILATAIGQVPPRQFLELAYGKFPTVMGSCTRLADPTPELVLSANDKLPPMDELLAMLEENKAFQTVLFWGHSPQKFTTESEQPFDLIVDDNKQRQMVAFIEGEYFTKTNGESPHTDEYYVVEDVLGPQLRKVYTRLCASDIAKFEVELQDDDTAKMINSLSANRGVVVLFSVTGELFPYQKGNTLGKQYEWGWVSNSLGFEEKSSKDVAPEEKKEPPKRNPLLGRHKSAVTVPVADTKTIAEKKAEEDAKIRAAADAAVDRAKATAAHNATIDPPKADTAVTETPLITPPEELMKKKDQKRINGWYDAWTDHTALTNKMKLEGMPAPANDKWKTTNAGKALQMKDALQHFRAKIGDSKLDNGYRPFQPVIGPRIKDAINALLDSGDVKAITEAKKVLNGDELKNPPDVTKYSEQMGRDVMDVLRWDPRVFDRFLLTCEKEKDFTPAIMLYSELVLTIEQLLCGDVKAVEVKVDGTPKDETPPADKTKEAPSPIKAKVSALQRFKQSA